MKLIFNQYSCAVTVGKGIIGGIGSMKSLSTGLLRLQKVVSDTPQTP